MSDHVEVLREMRANLGNNPRPIDRADAAALDAAIAALSAPPGWVMVPKESFRLALESIKVPKMSPLKQEFFKAGTHAVIRAFNEVIAAAPQPQPQPTSAAEQGAGGGLARDEACKLLRDVRPYLPQDHRAQQTRERIAAFLAANGVRNG